MYNNPLFHSLASDMNAFSVQQDIHPNKEAETKIEKAIVNKSLPNRNARFVKTPEVHFSQTQS
jgi:hypothetical protein